jgi:hypothetical protein
VKVRALVLVVMIQVPRVVETCFSNELIILYEVVFRKDVECSEDMLTGRVEVTYLLPDGSARVICVIFLPCIRMA